MGKGPKEQVVTQKLDPGMTQYRDDVFNKARSVANQGYTPYGGQRTAGADPYSTQAMGGMAGMPGAYDRVGGLFGDATHGLSGPNISPYAGAGSMAARALSGDQSAAQSLSNPFQSQVIDQLGTQYDKLRSQAAMGSADAATQAGAVGGDRAALAVGERLGDLDHSQASDVANLLAGNYNSTMDRASNTANLGLGAQTLAGNYGLGLGGLNINAAQGQLGATQGREGALMNQFGMGDYMHNINQAGLDTRYQDFLDKRGWGEHQLGVMTGAMNGAPYGNSSTQPMQGNKFNSMAGGAATGFGIGGPIGGVVGGVGGLLFG